PCPPRAAEPSMALRAGASAALALVLAAAGAAPPEGCAAAAEDEAAGLAQVRLRQLQRRAAAPAPECEWLTRPGEWLALPAAQACLDLIRGPAGRAKQHMQALARYYESFYTFAHIASDPTAGNYTFDPAFADLGIYGGANGGAPANVSGVDLVGDWQEIADSIPVEGTYPIQNWVAPANAAIHKLRDCHVDIWAEGSILPVRLLNLFVLRLADMSDDLVSIQISADQEKVKINGELKPIVTERKSGSVIKSIDQQPPMRWLTENIALSPTFGDYCAKSLGGRMNQVVADISRGIEYHLGTLGPLDGLNPGSVSVEFEGGYSAQWVWRVGVFPGSFLQGTGGNCADFACLVDNAPKWLERSGEFGKLVELTAKYLNGNLTDNALSLLSSEPAPRRTSPSPPSVAPVAASLPDDVFAWIGDPSDALGYLAFRSRSDGTEFGLLKYTTFVVSHLADVLADEWAKFVQEARSRGVTRLLVDFVGNGGGAVWLAYQFVQMMMPELEYKQTCGSLNRPIPEAYNLWSKINPLPIEQFISPELGPGLQADRRAELEADPAKAVLNSVRALLNAVKEFGLLEEVGLANITSILGVLASADVTWESGWESVQSLQPLYADLCPNPFISGGNPQYSTAYQHPRPAQSGKYTRNFTARVYVCPKTTAGLGGIIAHPFEDIVFVSDGTCGSSCYMAAQTTWAAARAWSNRSVRFVTWGGVGGSADENKKTLSPTAFPGGNVYKNGAVMVRSILSCLLVQLSLAFTVGSDELVSQLIDVWNEMTSMVPLYSATEPPYFTQSQVYQPAFGKNAPPGEYVFTPTDLVLPAWFSGVAGSDASRWNVTQLDAMHQMAAQAFE
ncbi:unnamed protein product, partial [Prorocentrum cordatum]